MSFVDLRDSGGAARTGDERIGYRRRNLAEGDRHSGRVRTEAVQCEHADLSDGRPIEEEYQCGDSRARQGLGIFHDPFDESDAVASGEHGCCFGEPIGDVDAFLCLLAFQILHEVPDMSPRSGSFAEVFVQVCLVHCGCSAAMFGPQPCQELSGFCDLLLSISGGIIHTLGLAGLLFESAQVVPASEALNRGVHFWDRGQLVKPLVKPVLKDLDITA